MHQWMTPEQCRHVVDWLHGRGLEFYLECNSGLYAIEQLLSHLGIAREDTIAFGDSMNDCAMIQACGHGVVMGNGSQELKQYGDAICESVQDDGIYHELHRLGLF